ncbi:hypothetical protein SAMN04489835_3147 [Mycolicibacterium rutilum]|uniref:Uncharacterized protein n=1 Tax=Mycolicibacterium rutilum TaxID=370526 RepID=A0A1H6KHR3_MYCRU|nr:hypothetical protein [Mycolicibacterium rutilum]SEH71057.1 hypothetical protein SAMN04489835_3147 [Mycolicibacterium rutilum]
MREHALAPAENQSVEALATTGLFLIFTSVIAVAVFLASWSASDTAMAALSGTIAALSFVLSMVCFAVQSRDN